MTDCFRFILFVCYACGCSKKKNKPKKKLTFWGTVFSLFQTGEKKKIHLLFIPISSFHFRWFFLLSSFQFFQRKRTTKRKKTKQKAIILAGWLEAAFIWKIVLWHFLKLGDETVFKPVLLFFFFNCCCCCQYWYWRVLFSILISRKIWVC